VDGKTKSKKSDIAAASRRPIKVHDEDHDDDACNEKTDYVAHFPKPIRKRVKHDPRGFLWKYVQEHKEDEARSAEKLGPKFAAMDAQHVRDMNQINGLLVQSASMFNQSERVVPQQFAQNSD